MTYRALAQNGETLLAQAGIENAAAESVRILCAILNIDATRYLLQSGRTADAETEARYFALIQKRTERVPLQYLLGEAEFLGFSFTVGEGVLIPRPETEELADLCADRIRKCGYRTVFDLCAGSGCIGISIAMLCPEAEIWLFEKYDEAIRYLRMNIPRSATARLHIVKADIFTYDPALLPGADLIVSNPPYVSTEEIAALQAEVQKEPRTALDGGADGLTFYRCIANRWAAAVRPGGCIALECGETQSAEIARLFTAGKTEELRDMYGTKRFVFAEF